MITMIFTQVKNMFHLDTDFYTTQNHVIYVILYINALFTKLNFKDSYGQY